MYILSSDRFLLPQLQVRTFKEKIEAQKGTEFPANCQKLIYAGKKIY